MSTNHSDILQPKMADIPLELEDGFALASINIAYADFTEQAQYPWLVKIELESLEVDEHGHPTGKEAEELLELEEAIYELLRETQVVHYLGHVKRNEWYDCLFYIDEPKFDHKKMNQFFDEVNEDRGIEVFVEPDEEWEFVEGFFE